MTAGQYRSRSLAGCVVAFSVAYERDNLLARGMGWEHLRGLLLCLARLMLRHSADLAYGGNWKKTDDNFLFPLLDLICAEQEDEGLGIRRDNGSDLSEPDANPHVSKLYNHLAWPWYLNITPTLEAQWVNCCRIVRVRQQDAGFLEADIVADGDAHDGTLRSAFNAAVTVSKMRRVMMEKMEIRVPDAPPGTVPPAIARVLLGGKVERYSGFLPGIFEEALVTLEKQRPVYILGGFGGAAEKLAEAILDTGTDRHEVLTLDWHKAQNLKLGELLEYAHTSTPPRDFVGTAAMLDALFSFVQNARADLSGTLNTGLSDEETRELLQTQNVNNAVRLVRTGLEKIYNLPSLTA